MDSLEDWPRLVLRPLSGSRSCIRYLRPVLFMKERFKQFTKLFYAADGTPARHRRASNSEAHFAGRRGIGTVQVAAATLVYAYP